MFVVIDGMPITNNNSSEDTALPLIDDGTRSEEGSRCARGPRSSSPYYIILLNVLMYYTALS
jgi:hypothetical protein